jgi:hypothetical protein
MQKKISVWLITCCSLAHTTRPNLYNSTLVSLQLFKPTPTSLQLDFLFIWTLSHGLYLLELLAWSYSDTNSTWYTPQLSFQLNRIPHPWPGLGLPQPWLFLTQTQALDPPLDSGSISTQTCFLNLLLEFTWTTYQCNLYPIGSPESCLNCLPEPHLSTLPEPDPITSMLTQLYMFTSGWITLSNSSPDRTSTYPALYGLTRPNYPTRFLSRSNFYLLGLTRSYLAELPYPILLPIRLLPTRWYLAILPDFLTR